MIAKRKILFRAGAAALILLIAGAMFIAGRGHTVYLDNRTIEYNGETYSALARVVIFVDGKQIARLYEKERGMSICIGQTFTMSLAVTQTRDSAEETVSATIRLPLSMDGVLINLPAFLAGLPREAYLSEFVIAPPEPEADDQGLVTDEEGAMPEDWGDF